MVTKMKQNLLAIKLITGMDMLMLESCYVA